MKSILILYRKNELDTNLLLLIIIFYFIWLPQVIKLIFKNSIFLVYYSQI